MAKYKLTEQGALDQETGSFIPNDLRNRHWQEYQKWLAEGNAPDPLDIPAPWFAIRDRRNHFLTACDWTQISDAPITAEQKTAWATYRQELRDIPQTYANPDAVVWPTKPA